MDQQNNAQKSLNSNQRLILSIGITLVLLVITLAIAQDNGRRRNPFDFSRTWYLWLIFVTIAGFVLNKFWGHKVHNENDPGK